MSGHRYLTGRQRHNTCNNKHLLIGHPPLMKNHMLKLVYNTSVQLFILAFFIRLLVLILIGMFGPHSFETLSKWYNADSYLDIAGSFPLPYDPPDMAWDTKNYPLFPFFIYVSSLIFDNIVFCGYFVVVVFSSLATVIFYKIAQKFSDNAFSLALIFCCFSPRWLALSTYLWSEPVFIFFLLLAFLFFIKDDFLPAFVSLGICSIARPVGILFIGSFLLFSIFYKREILISIIKYSIVAIIPFALFHLYLFFRFDEMLLFSGQVRSWGGQVLSYPLHGLIARLLDPTLLTVGKYILFPNLFFILLPLSLP